MICIKHRSSGWVRCRYGADRSFEHLDRKGSTDMPKQVAELLLEERFKSLKKDTGY